MSDDPLVELLEIARDIRTQLDWHTRSGSFGLPRSTPDDIARWFPPVAAGTSTSAAVAPVVAAPSAERGAIAAPSAERDAIAAPSAERDAIAAPSVERAAPAPALESAPPRPALAARSPAAEARLTVLASEARACTRCALHVERQQAVFARGNGSSGLCFVGEGPGADEDAQGFPFVGAAGQLLDRMIEAMGIAREDVYVCNIVKCRPPKNRKPEPEEMAACMPYLEEQIELLAPVVLVALGATAVQGLLGTTDGITRLRGKWKLYRGRIPVMPTFHPAYLLRTPGAKREVWDDLQAVLRQMGRAVPERRR